jgi:DNA invertase Pin-like site-specific DNA recombinase
MFKEKESGREGVRRPEPERAIEALGPRDVLVLAEWNRATRSMLDGIRIIERVAGRGATLKALDREWLDLTTPVGKGILAFWLRTSGLAFWLAQMAAEPLLRSAECDSVLSRGWLPTRSARQLARFATRA